jgi:hypothetical protein
MGNQNSSDICFSNNLVLYADKFNDRQTTIIGYVTDNNPIYNNLTQYKL